MINSLSRILNANIGQSWEKTNKNAKKIAILVKKVCIDPFSCQKPDIFRNFAVISGTILATKE